MSNKELVVLGIRGVPAGHGGFETFAEYLCPFLIKNGWQVTVYCQEDGEGEMYESQWQGVKRIHIPVKNEGPLGTIIFDLKSVWHARKNKGLHLTLGYNTACFNIIQRLYSINNVINMDGIEWKRQKWGFVAKTWFWLNERFGCWFGNHLVADHPKIEDHLATRVARKKITMIPYGGPDVSMANEAVLADYRLVKNEYAIVIARPEPENSILEVVEAFSAKPRSHKLVVLGKFLDSNPYHQQVLAAASNDVVFPGAIYEAEKVAALRFYARFYVHGHQVGGTNPSLVEGLAAGCAVIAHDNKLNRWVAGNGAFYFANKAHLSEFLDQDYLNDDFVKQKSAAAKDQFITKFQWGDILTQYETLLTKYLK